MDVITMPNKILLIPYPNVPKIAVAISLLPDASVEIGSIDHPDLIPSQRVS